MSTPMTSASGYSRAASRDQMPVVPVPTSKILFGFSRMGA
jgi:hypothetical protein